MTRAGLFRTKAFAHNGKGEYDEAIEAADDGLEIQGAAPITRAELFEEKAFAHYGKGEYDKAIEAAKEGGQIKNLPKSYIEAFGKIISLVEKNKTEVNEVAETVFSLGKHPRDEDSNENKQPRKKR
ncbi:MAG: hypothetical protein K1000chlam3_00129 [Chlamydiae bacterium]|nr:hypothetical protein [Chlamydiota bacterium]